MKKTGITLAVLAVVVVIALIVGHQMGKRKAEKDYRAAMDGNDYTDTDETATE